MQELSKVFNTKTKGKITGLELVKFLIEKQPKEVKKSVETYFKVTQERASELVEYVKGLKEESKKVNTALPVETVNSLKTLGERFKSIFSSLSSKSSEALELKRKYDSFEIQNDEQDKEIAALLKQLREDFKKEGNERKEITSQLDSLKTPLISFEKDIKTTGEFLKAKRDSYAQKVYNEKKRAEEERAIKAAKEQEIVKVKHYISQGVENALLELIQQSKSWFNDAFVNLTLENSEKLFKTIDFKPVLKEEKYNNLFQIPQTVYLRPEELTDIITQAKAKYTYDAYNTRYMSEIEEIKKEFILKAENRLRELKSGKKAQEEIDKENEAIKQQEKQAIEKEKKELEQMFATQLTTEALEVDLNNLEVIEEKETPKGTSITYEGQVLSREAYVSLVAHYISLGGDERKLKFLSTFAAKNGRPEIEGVQYVEVVKSSLKGQ